MKNIFESVIKRGGFDLNGMLKRIDTYHLEGKLTDVERAELYDAAREKAQAVDSIAVMTKLQELEQRVKALEAGQAGGGESAVEYPEFVAGKWYYASDNITFEGEKYVCCAPAGQVCVWSPADYPAFWQKVAA